MTFRVFSSLVLFAALACRSSQLAHCLAGDCERQNGTECLRGDCLTGYGLREAWLHGKMFARYAGEFRNGQRHGKGKDEFYLNGELIHEYRGQFEADQEHGSGEQYAYRHGRLRSRFTGNFISGQRTGKGVDVWYWESGEVHRIQEGVWESGRIRGPTVIQVRDPRGLLWWSADIIQNDDAHAIGKITLYQPPGTLIGQYEGDLLNYQRHGRGVYVPVLGHPQRGLWKDDRYVGP